MCAENERITRVRAVTKKRKKNNRIETLRAKILIFNVER